MNASVKILRGYERGVLFTLGRFSRIRGPRLICPVPLVAQIVRVDSVTAVIVKPFSATDGFEAPAL